MHISSYLLDLIFPSRCAGCRTRTENGTAICEACFAAIPIHTSLFCGECRARRVVSRRLCHPKFPYLLAAATDYHHPAITNLIHALKFRSAEAAAQPLAKLTTQYLSSLSLALPRPVVVPIPLSARRERERGFNQALLIGRAVADHFFLPLVSDALLRSRHTPPQSETKGFDARRDNVRGCFRVAHIDHIVGRNIILVDDVITSGATCAEAARVLKEAGARRIIALAPAMA